MLLGKYLEALVRASAKVRSPGYKTTAILLGTAVFFLVVPFLLFLAGYVIEKHLIAPRGRLLETVFALVCAIVGVVFAGWAVLTQVRIGKGTPVPIAPPQKLIVTGPYRLCRNPIQLGANLYYLGVGTYFGSLGIGVLMFILGLILGSSYHRFVEERELALKFGAEYEEYKKRTPFLIPKFKG
ncbi:MAG: isoprenylcysteine carboxylmethyltransferase family protein [Thermodesulfobacteriota bacterium]